MSVLIGTSGYAYEPWRERFYPAGLSSSKMLAHYAERFATVELNGTFRTPPTAEGMAKLATQVSTEFVFSIKAPQAITAWKRLRGVETDLRELFAALAPLGSRLGPVLFQLPHNFKKDHALLAAFLSQLPSGPEVALDFRHGSWLDDDTFVLLAEHGAALCITDEEETEMPVIATAPFGYLRLRRDRYPGSSLVSWAEEIVSAGWDRSFVYFKHEDTARGVRFSRALQGILQSIGAAR